MHGPLSASLNDTPASIAEARQGNRRSLRSLRVLKVLCITVPLVIFTAFAAYRHHQIHREAEIRLDRALRVAHEHALRVLDTNETMLGHIVELVQGNDDAALRSRHDALQTQLGNLIRNKPQIRAVWIIDAQGRPLLSTRYPAGPPDIDLSDRPAFQWHQRNGRGLYFSELQTGRATHERFFDMSRGLFGPDGRFIGTVAVSLDPEYFTRLHADLSDDEPGLAITMFRGDGAVLTRWPMTEAAPGRMSAQSPVLSRVLKGEVAGTLRGVSSLDQRDRVILFRKLGDYPIYIGSGRELSAVNAEWAEEIGVIAAFSIVPVLGLLFAAYVASRRTREALAAAERLRDESMARRQVEEALLQAQKLEALGRLTGGVAHDFNNALMVISGNLHLMRMKHPGVGGRFIDAMGRAVDSATKLTRQLLAFSRRQALVPETIALQARLPALRDLLAPILGSSVSLEIEVDPGTHPITVDTAELELAVINLAVNAKDAIAERGTFRLVARNMRGDGVGENARGRVVIEASDTGTGIDRAVLAKVFEPFFTTKPIGRGTGLGLSQVDALCRRAGGIASVESTPGQGTTVRMLFPAAAALPEERVALDPSFDRQVERSVLLVEDDDEVAAVIAPVLEQLGCRVRRVNAGAAALAWLQNHPDSADMVLTDVIMPGEIDGLALARHVKSDYPDLDVLLMTGYAEQMDTISRLGFDILPKPFSPDALADALQRLGKTSA